VGAPPRNREAAFPLSYAHGRQSQSDGQPHRDGSNLPTYASAGLDTSFAALAPWRGELGDRVAHLPALPTHVRHQDRARPSPAPTKMCSVHGGEWTKSHARSCRCRSSPRRAAGTRRRPRAAAWQGKELLRAVSAVGTAAARAALDRLLPLADGVRVAELSRLARTVRVWKARDPGLPLGRRLLQRAHRGRQPAHQEGQARRPRLPQLRQLPPTAATTLRRHMADSPHRKTARPLPTLGGVEPLCEANSAFISSETLDDNLPAQRHFLASILPRLCPPELHLPDALAPRIVTSSPTYCRRPVYADRNRTLYTSASRCRMGAVARHRI
jgi:hypothetical protein